MDKLKFKFPPIGARIIKSAVGVMLCSLVYLLRQKSGIPFYSMLAVLWCIQPYTGKTLTMAAQRTIGTFIGAFFGLISILLEIYLFNIYESLWGYFLTAVMIIPVIYVTILLNKKNASYFSCVVFLSITVNHITDANPLIFVGNRILDTLIGIAIAVALNSARLPRKKRRDTLFVAKLDDMLSPVGEQLTPYSKVEINRMIDDGLQLTIATMRTPASLMKPLEDVHIKLPVIVMDGAALYDINEKTYIQAYVMSNEIVGELQSLMRDNGFNCFINALCDDILIIYYGELQNSAERQLYEDLHKSPYRNYIKRAPVPADRIIYLMLIDETPKVKQFRDLLRLRGYDEKLKILCYPSTDYPGFSYIKIYNKNADLKNMQENLQADRSKIVKVGASLDNEIIVDSGLNAVVKAIRASYEPLRFKGK